MSFLYDALKGATKTNNVRDAINRLTNKNIQVNSGEQRVEYVNGKKKKRTDTILNLSGGVASGSINKKNAYGIGV